MDGWMGGWISIERLFSAGSPKTECHSNLCLQVQTDDPAGAMLAVGTENAQCGPGCREPRRLSLNLPSWILEPTPEADGFHMVGQRLKSVCSGSSISSCSVWPKEAILPAHHCFWWSKKDRAQAGRCYIFF